MGASKFNLKQYSSKEVKAVVLMVLIWILLGLLVGSLLNTVISRVPLGLPIMSLHSSRPCCKALIRVRDLIPIVSWIILKGRCRTCGARISFKYPAVELLTVLVFLWTYLIFGFSIRILPPVILALVLIAVSFIDWEHGIIPFSILAFAALPGLCFAVFGIGISLADSILGALAGGGFIFAVDIFSRIVFKRPGMGGGDVALMLASGLYLGLSSTVLALFLGVILGGLYASILLLTKRAKRHETFAFGPFLAAGCWIALLYGNEIVNWYMYR